MKPEYFQQLDLAFVDIPYLQRLLAGNEKKLDIGAIMDLFCNLEILYSIRKHREELGIPGLLAFYKESGGYDNEAYEKWETTEKKAEIEKRMRGMLRRMQRPEQWLDTISAFALKGVYDLQLATKPKEDEDETLLPGIGSPKRATYNIAYDTRSVNIQIFPGLTRKKDLDKAWREISRSESWENRSKEKTNKLAHFYMFLHKDCAGGRFDKKFAEKMKEDFHIRASDFGSLHPNNFENLKKNYSKTAEDEGWSNWRESA